MIGGLFVFYHSKSYGIFMGVTHWVNCGLLQKIKKSAA